MEKCSIVRRTYILQAVSRDASSASVSPRYCLRGQTATSIPVTRAGIPKGALLSFDVPSGNTLTCCLSNYKNLTWLI